MSLIDTMREIQLKRLDNWINDEGSKVSNCISRWQDSNRFQSTIISSGRSAILSLYVEDNFIPLISIIKSQLPYFWWRQTILSLNQLEGDSEVESQTLQLATFIRAMSNLQVVSSIDYNTNKCIIEMVKPVDLKSIRSQEAFIQQMEMTKEAIESQVIPILHTFEEQQRNNNALIEEHYPEEEEEEDM